MTRAEEEEEEEDWRVGRSEKEGGFVKRGEHKWEE